MKTLAILSLLLPAVAYSAEYRCEPEGRNLQIPEFSHYELIQDPQTESMAVLDSTGQLVAELALHTDQSSPYWVSSEGRIAVVKDGKGNLHLYLGQMFACEEK